jgi:hypothetical protein
MHGSDKMCPKPATTKLGSSIGKTFTLVGIARDAKGGAVLVTPGGELVYIEDLDYWPSELWGKEISVTGVLQEKKYIPDPLTTPNGAISQGAYGNQYVLEKAQWGRT